ncbi:MAG: hemolysin family protein, partial [Acidobacteria bacterium]|nr:hemolysin family protein [Acidobacteriota bacterium]
MEQATFGPDEIAIRLAAVLALVFANGFFVAAEFALVTVRKTRIDQLIAEGSSLARPVRRALSDPESYIAATQLAITMTSLGLGWLGEPAVATLIEPAFAAVPMQMRAVTVHSVSVAVAFALITALHIVLGELAPKTVALQHAERTALVVGRPTELFMRVFWPFIFVLNHTGRGVVRLLGLKPPSGSSLVHSEEELKMLVTASQEAGVIEEDEEQMLHRVFGFGDLTAGQVMLPRTEMPALPVRTTRADLVERLSHADQPVLPVYRAHLDDIVGAVRVRELFRVVSGPLEDIDLAPTLQDPLTVPETMKADDLLTAMRERRMSLAIIIDEYGGTAGMVTFQRLMERIVGEIGAESDGVVSAITTLTDGSALVDGLALTTDVNVQFGLGIDEDLYDTIGGYVLGRIGRRPRLGDSVDRIL